MLKTTYISLVIMLIFSISAFGDIDYADSPEFTLDLLTVPGTGMAEFSDSDSFYLNLLSLPATSIASSAPSASFYLDLEPVNRGFADASFSYDWAEGTDPVVGEPLQCRWDIHYEKLLELDSSGNWQPIANAPLLGSKLIIMNHGWNDGPDGDSKGDNVQDNDLLDLARKIKAKIEAFDTIDSNVYIYCWKWGDGPDTISDANPNGKPGPIDIANILKYFESNYDPLHIMSSIALGDKGFLEEINLAKDNAKKHGGELGKVLTSDAAQMTADRYNIHMIAHSFGGIVCAEAAKMVNSKSNGHKVKQITTLETPALPWPFPNAVKDVKPDLAQRVEVIYYHWLTDLDGIGFGGPTNNGSNLLNLHASPVHYRPLLNGNFFTPLHRRIIEWYIDSINNTASCSTPYYGFNWSFIRNDLNPSWPAGLPTGRKTESISELGCLQPWLGEQIAVKVAKKVIKTKEDFASVASWVGKGVAVTGNWVGNKFVTSLNITSMTTLVMAPAEAGIFADPIDEGTTAGVFKEIAIPETAENLEIDLRFTSVVPGHFFAILIGDDTLMRIDAAAEGISEQFETYSAYIGKYAGQTVTIQIAIEGTGQDNTNVLIDSISFTEVTINSDVNGDGAVDVNDLVDMLEYWTGPVYAPGDASDNADLSGDGKIDLNDFIQLINDWGWEKNYNPETEGE
ncbi:MAG: hypothetical protein JEZ07_17555 [Phycisphaerae bacterium]|nr:hypothetical protein [Phycisphaerae bacterium]